MSCETTKATPRRCVMDLFQRAFTGDGIDIGAGPDPLHPGRFPAMRSCEAFDMEHGDANVIHTLRTCGSYDFVHASQCLEHMRDPEAALQSWIKLLRPDGWLVFSVPDWRLYEGCNWPSYHNPDHKTAWGLGPLNPQVSCNRRGRDPVPYINMLEFVPPFGLQIMLIQIADTRYDYSLLLTSRDQTLSENAEAFIEVVLWNRHL